MSFTTHKTRDAARSLRDFLREFDYCRSLIITLADGFLLIAYREGCAHA